MIPKHGTGIWGKMNRSLNIVFEEYEWYLTIHRTDRKEDDKFFSLNQKEVTPDKIREFVSNWEEFKWKRAGFKGICKAVFNQNGNYKLYLILPESASITLDKAVEQFGKFMGASERSQEIFRL